MVEPSQWRAELAALTDEITGIRAAETFLSGGRRPKQERLVCSGAGYATASGTAHSELRKEKNREKAFREGKKGADRRGPDNEAGDGGRASESSKRQWEEEKRGSDYWGSQGDLDERHF